MADAGHQLMIKYGLARAPSEEKVAQWARLTRQYIDTGEPREAAGAAAAKQLFPDYNTRHYASEADTIEALLRAVEGK